MEPRQTAELFGPVALLMGQSIHAEVQLETASTFSEFNARISRHLYDIALIQPMDYPLVVEKLGYIPVAKIDEPLVTRLMVRSDSSLLKLSDIRGKTIGLPPEQSANARMILRALRENHLVPGKNVTIRYFKSHDSCLQQVWIGEISACGTSSSPIMLFEQRMKARLRSIYDSEPIPRTLFVAHPRVSSALLRDLKSGILSWGTNPEDRAILKNLGFHGFQAVRPGEYDVIHKYLLKDAGKTARQEFSGEIFLGVFPFLGTRQISESFSPVLTALRKATGFPVYLRTAANFDLFAGSIADEKFDVAIIQPFDFKLAMASNYLPVAAMKNMLEGHFMVKQDSHYHSVKDLRGKLVAMPPFNSVQAHLGRNALLEAGLEAGKDLTIDYRSSHEACLQQVLSGEAAACITGDIAMSKLPAEMVTGLRKMGKAEKLPGVLFVVHKRMPAELRRKVQDEIISWRKSTQGKKILESMGMGEFTDADWQAYRRIPE